MLGSADSRNGGVDHAGGDTATFGCVLWDPRRSHCPPSSPRTWLLPISILRIEPWVVGSSSDRPIGSSDHWVIGSSGDFAVVEWFIRYPAICDLQFQICDYQSRRIDSSSHRELPITEAG